MDEFIQTETTIVRDHQRSTREHAPWKLSFIKRTSPKTAHSNVEWMTQGELLTLWQQIGALFNLEGMRAGLTDEDLEKMGVKRR